MDWTTMPVTPDLLRGALDLERTEHGVLPHRLPARARAQCPDGQLAMTEAQPSGVRLVFRTRATAVELDTLRTAMAYEGAPPRPDGVYDLLVDGHLTAQACTTGGKVLTVDMATGAAETRHGPVGTVRFPPLSEGVKHVEIWLPYNEITELVALRTDAPVEALPDAGRPVWLHHGSSISHGSNAASPATIWPALAASLGGVELVNLGLGGNALLDPFTARALRETPADLISIKIGINLVNKDLMRMRAFTPAVHGFLDTIREGHPTTPLLVVSPVLCPIHEDTPGPSEADLTHLGEGQLQFRAAGDPAQRATGPADIQGRLTLNVIRDELARVVQQRVAGVPGVPGSPGVPGDAYLHYLDGRELYGEADSAELPLPDQVHPDAATHRRIGEHFAALAFGPDGPLATHA